MFLGDIQEGIMLLGFVIVIMGIEFYQERKTERALDALKDLASPRALVIRDGEEKRIAGREVVMGDMVVLQEGDRVPADATVISSINLMADESLLTGEAVPVRKTDWNLVGGQDPRLSRCYGSGKDFYTSLHKIGKEIHMCDDVVINHHGQYTYLENVGDETYQTLLPCSSLVGLVTKSLTDF